MRDRVPSFFMLIPGDWRDAKHVVKALHARGIAAKPTGDGAIKPNAIRADVVEPGDLAAAFGWGRQGPLATDLLRRIATCPNAALIECGRRFQDAPQEIAALGRALRDAGGLAIRMEASGCASAWDPWLEKLESGDPRQLYASAVLVVEDDDVMFTCGMHHFDLPDAQIATEDPTDAITWLDELCVYQIAETPTLLSGHNFAPTAETPRRTLERWPDHRHHPSDGRHNPFGIWRLVELSARRIEATRTVPIIKPSLVALLLSAERSAGRALTKRDVENIVDDSPAIAMEPNAVAVLERSRGYADIEPQLAWEQWQIVRRTL